MQIHSKKEKEKEAGARYLLLLPICVPSCWQRLTVLLVVEHLGVDVKSIGPHAFKACARFVIGIFGCPTMLCLLL
jgi:hypothetical protein